MRRVRIIEAAGLFFLPLLGFPRAWSQGVLSSENTAFQRADTQKEKPFSLKDFPLSEEEEKALPESYRIEGDSILGPDGKALTQEELLELLRPSAVATAENFINKGARTREDQEKIRRFYRQRYPLLPEDQRAALGVLAGLNLPSAPRLALKAAQNVTSFYGVRELPIEQARRTYRLDTAADGYFVRGNSYRSRNYIVTVQGGSPGLAKRVAEEAERYREDLARKWGVALAPSANPVPIRAIVEPGPSGATHLWFHREGRVGAEIEVRGSEDEILQSALPHEINHTIFAARFRVPLPRWADEGAASTVESLEEKEKLRRNLSMLWQQGRVKNLRELFSIMEYPADMKDMAALYAQGHSVTQFLLSRKGEQGYLSFIQDGLGYGWDHAAKKNYGFQSVEQMQEAWRKWVGDGSLPSRPKPAFPPGANVGSLVSIEPPAGKVPNFTFKGPDGRPVKLSDLRGKPVLLDFSLEGCGPCRQAADLLKHLHSRYGDDLAIISVHTKAQDIEGLKKSAIQEGILYPVVHDPDAKIEESMGRVGGYPYFMLLNAKGEKIWDQEGYKNEVLEREDIARRVAQLVQASGGLLRAGSLEGEAELAGEGFDGSGSAGSGQGGSCSGGSCSGAGGGSCGGGGCSGGGSGGGAKRGAGGGCARSARAADGSPDRDVGGPGLWLLTVVLARFARKARKRLARMLGARRSARTRARPGRPPSIRRKARNKNSSARKNAARPAAGRKSRVRGSAGRARADGDTSRKSNRNAHRA